MLAQLSVGLQSDTWHTDNFANAPGKLAVGEVIMEVRPILQLDIGNPPAGRIADAFSTEYYAHLRYEPTLHSLPETGSARTLQRVSGEIGRANPVVVSLVSFQYDQNIFGARGNDTVEESTTVTEVTPSVRYNLNAKTALTAAGTWRRVAPQDSTVQRSEYVLDTGIECAATVKTTLGAGMEFAHIRFDQAQFGAQNYQQLFGTMTWQSSPKIRFQTRAGVELREFDSPLPKPLRVSPVATTVVNWIPDDLTQCNAGLLVRNQPSVSVRGATFQEIRIGADAKRRVAEHFYVQGEATIYRRAYDTGARELEAVLRPAFGFHTQTSRLFDSLNVELYYQFRHLDSNVPGAFRSRNIFGIESTLFF